MPFAGRLQTNFTAGEISPRLFARVDLEKYGSAAAEIENMIILPHGGLTRRPGFRFVDPVKDSEKFTRLIPFEISSNLQYILQFGDQYIRFHTDHATVIDGRDFTNGDFSSALDGWTDKSTGTGSSAHDAANNRVTLNGGASGVGLVYQSFEAVSANNFYSVSVESFGGATLWAVGTTEGGNEISNGTSPVGVSSFTFQSPVSQLIYISFGNDQNDDRQVTNVVLTGPRYELDSPYTENDLSDLKFAQTSEALFIAHPDWAPRMLERIGTNNWKLSILDFADGPYLDTNKTDTTLTPSATGPGPVTVTASNTLGINDDQGFLATDSGRLIRLEQGTSGDIMGWGVITAVTSELIVTVEARDAGFAAVTATAKWRLGAWSETTGWPSAVGFFEQRVVFANTVTQVDRFWMSKAGLEQVQSYAPTNLDGAVVADNAITYQIADDQVNSILWVDGGDVLMIGTASAEYVVRSSDQRSSVAPDDIEVKRQTTRGSDRFTRPIRIDQQLLYVQRAGRKLRNFFFQLEINGYISDDITIIAEHITKGRIIDMAYQQEPDSMIWCARGDGVLLGLTYQRDQGVIGWSRSIVGGTSAIGNAVVESVASIRTPDGNADETWAVVARTINGQTVRYIEFLEQPFEASAMLQADALFVDSALTYDGPPIMSFSGIDHLEGETISVLADGAVHPDVTVSGGGFTLTKPASKVQAGYRYRSRVKMLSPEAGGGPGPALHKTKRVSKAYFDFYETLGAQYGVEGRDLDLIPFRKMNDPMDSPPPIFTGIKEILFPKGYDRRIEPVVVQDNPLPMTLLAVTLDMAVNE